MSHCHFASFSPALTQFLDELARNNNRTWFNNEKIRYENDVVVPVLNFVTAIKPRLMEISPYLMVEATKVGGSLFRIYRDTRFSKDKTPYKTHVGVRFPHRQFKRCAGPGLYMHISPQEFYLAAGVWHPQSSALAKIRLSIDRDPEAWLRVRDDRDFSRLYSLFGESLKGAPRGYRKDHPCIVDLRRKDFAGVRELPAEILFSESLLDEVTATYRVASPFLHFLARALEVPF